MAIDSGRAEPRSRRAILAGAIGGVAAMVASRLASPDKTSAVHLPGFGHANAAGSADTSLTTSSAGTALLVTQNGTGTALRGSAVGPGSIAGFFTANNGTGVSGVTGTGGSYGVFAANNGATGLAGALRAAGGNNHGIVATTSNSTKNAILASANVAGASAILGTATQTGVEGVGFRGVYGHTNDAGAIGVLGYGGTGDGNVGVQGDGGTGDGNVGVRGVVDNATGIGVYGVVTSATGAGVSGTNDGAAFGGGVAILASGNKNHGVVASTADLNANAVVATTNAEGGIAIFAENTSAGVDIAAGSGIRALSGGGTLGHIHPGGLYNDGAGEFAGPIGVIGASTENDDGVFVGVLGLGGATGYGVLGIGDAAAGVYGTSHFSPGVYAASDLGFGTFSLAVSGIGVYGQSQSSSGVSGYSSSGNGLHGQSSSGYAIYGNGNGAVTGTFSKASGTFRIDHPLDPANKFLSHSFVESPDMMNIYNGIATLDAKGEATVTLPAWFGTLNKEFRYQLTAIGSAGPNLHVKSKVNGNAFAIGGGPAGQEVSWQLTGIRQDAWANAHRVVVEEAKPKGQKGLYLHPKENGQPESRGIGYADRKALDAQRPTR